MLREAGARKRNQEGWTQLIFAAVRTDVERVRQLFRLGCPNANAQDQWGTTAVRRASFAGYEAVVRELLAQGADANIKNEDGFTPLMWAIYYGHLAVVRLLSDAPGVDLAAHGTLGEQTLTALGWAQHRHHADITAFLSSRGAPK